jgi:hypothetical protein
MPAVEARGHAAAWILAKEPRMSVQSHIDELERKHAELERELETALAHPGVDSLEVSDLKRRKLHLKDEIARLRRETVH